MQATSFAPQTPVKVTQGTHKGKKGNVGEGTGTKRNKGKIPVELGRFKEVCWINPDWVEAINKVNIPAPWKNPSEFSLVTESGVAIDVKFKPGCEGEIVAHQFDFTGPISPTGFKSHFVLATESEEYQTPYDYAQAYAEVLVSQLEPTVLGRKRSPQEQKALAALPPATDKDNYRISTAVAETSISLADGLDITPATQDSQSKIASDQDKTAEEMKLEAITPTATPQVDACNGLEFQRELETESALFKAVEDQATPSDSTAALIQLVPDQAEAEGINVLPQGHLWIDQIECLPQMQQRLYINPVNVCQYQEMLAFSEPPPVTVYQVDERLILVDGFHRIRASADDGRKTIPAIIKQGTWSDALLASCTANAYNGQAMSTADKRRAVTTMLVTLEQLSDPDPRKKWSNREIARQTGASESSVRNIRAELEMSAQIAQFADGDRVQVICPDNCQDLTYFRTNTLGTVQGLDKKKGLFIIPDNGSLDWNGLLQPSAWVHPERVIKLDSPTACAQIAHSQLSDQPSPTAQIAHSQLSDQPSPTAQIAHSQLSADLDWQVNNLCQYRGLTGQIVRIEGDGVWVSFNGQLEMVPIFEIQLPADESTRTCGSETKPSSVKQETAQQGKSLGLKATGETTFPSIPANPDVGDEPVPVMASATNGAAIANGKPDVVAVEIAIGMRHLTPEQLTWAVESSASAGLSDTHLKSLIKAAKRVLSKRHHPEYGKQ